MLIDIHVHAARRRLPSVQFSSGQYFALPHELVGMMDQYGIDKAIVLPVMSPDWQRGYITPEEVLEVCALHPTRLIPFCSLDGRMCGNGPKADFGPLLRYYKEAGCKGVGEYMTNLPFDEPRQLNFFRQVEEIGLPLLFHIGPTLGECYGCYDEAGLPRLENVLKACPKLIFIGHSQPFWAEISADCNAENRNSYPKGTVTPGRLVQLMRAYPNLWGDISAGSGFNAVTRDPAFGLQFLAEFQDRLLFGTDICYCPQELPQVAFFRKLREEKLLPVEVIDKIAWKNADRLLGLGLS